MGGVWSIGAQGYVRLPPRSYRDLHKGEIGEIGRPVPAQGQRRSAEELAMEPWRLVGKSAPPWPRWRETVHSRPRGSQERDC